MEASNYVWIKESFNDRMKELAEGCRKEYGVSSDDPYGLKLTACLQAIEPMIKQLQENKSERIIELARRSDAFVQDDLPRLQTLALAKGVVIWFLPCLVVYLLGFGLAWVRSGFHKRHE